MSIYVYIHTYKVVIIIVSIIVSVITITGRWKKFAETALLSLRSAIFSEAFFSNIYIYIYIYMYVCIFTYVYYVDRYIDILMCIHIYIYNRERDIDIDIEGYFYLDQVEAPPGKRRRKNPPWFLEGSKNHSKNVPRTMNNYIVAFVPWPRSGPVQINLLPVLGSDNPVLDLGGTTCLTLLV